ncbi:hypothetical protein [Pseudomonas nitroreducens]|nr:hypothetical protein [Pseudomonas nitroreducens]
MTASIARVDDADGEIELDLGAARVSIVQAHRHSSISREEVREESVHQDL